MVKVVYCKMCKSGCFLRVSIYLKSGTFTAMVCPAIFELNCHYITEHVWQCDNIQEHGQPSGAQTFSPMLLWKLTELWIHSATVQELTKIKLMSFSFCMSIYLNILSVRSGNMLGSDYIQFLFWVEVSPWASVTQVLMSFAASDLSDPCKKGAVKQT